MRILFQRPTNQITKAHTNVEALAVTAKSLFRNILRVTYLFSIICGGHLPPSLRKSHKTIYFAIPSIKTRKQNFQAKSLLFKILPINFLESRIYKENSIPVQRKTQKTSTLRCLPEK